MFLAALLALVLPSQTPSVIPLSSEPHHHLVFHNRFVNVYHVEVAPHDAVLLHRHDYDAISIMLADAEVTVHAQGKPDAHQNLTAAQVRLQPMGYAHSTAIDGDTTYRNVTVELLLPQHAESNLCAAVMPGQPLHCDATPAEPQEKGWRSAEQFQTDRTRVSLERIEAHRGMTLDKSSGNLLLIAIDPVGVKAGKESKEMRSGDFMWLAAGHKTGTIRNPTDREARIVTFFLRD
jgi:hypothetical protein